MPSTMTSRIDGISTSTAMKAPVRCATTANITLSGLQTIDGVALAADDRVLVKNQTDATENGIYVADTSAWSRAKDFDGNRDVRDGTMVFVANGTAGGNSFWNVTTNDPITIGTSSINFELSLPNSLAVLSFTQTGTGALSRSAQGKLRDCVHAFDFIPENLHAGIIARTSTTDVSSYLQAALNTAREVRLPDGKMRIATTLNPRQARLVGEGPDRSLIECNGVHAFTFPADAGFDRPAAILEGFGIDSTGTSCDGKFAFYMPGVASGAAAVYNSGITIRDVEIGRNGRMGGGFYVKDVFRLNVQDVGMTDVSRMIQLVGSVVQAKFRNVASNNDSAGTTLLRYGLSTESATYDSGTMTPEDVRFIDCAYIRGVRGIDHRAGLLIEFANFDAETTGYGAILDAPCTMRGGLVAPAPSTTDYVGILRNVSPSNPDDGTILDGVDINALNTPSGTAYAVQIGDGVSPVYGFVMRNCRIRGNANAFDYGIYGRDVRDATIEDNFIRSTAVSATDIDVQGSRLFILRNRVPGGDIVVSDNGVSTAYGAVEFNQCGSLSLTLTTPANWRIGFNENLSNTYRRPYMLTGSKTWDIPSTATGSKAETTVIVSGARAGDACMAGINPGGVAWLLSAHVQSDDTVRVVGLNQEGSTTDPSSQTLTVWVVKG